MPAAALIAGTIAALGFVVIQYFAAWAEGDAADDDPCQNSQVRVIEAAWRHDAEEVSILLARGADPNRRTDGVSALSCALRDDSYRPAARAETVSALLDAGADPDDAGSGATPLLRSVQRSDDTTVDLLLASDADPGLGGPVNPATLLSDPPPDLPPELRTSGPTNLPPLVLAAWDGDLLVAVQLLAADADPDAAADSRMTALHAAAAQGHRDVVEILLAADADRTPDVERGVPTPAETASAVGHDDIARLLERPARTGS